MAEARVAQAWHHTSAVLALLANCHRDPKKQRPFTPADFHPIASHKPTSTGRQVVPAAEGMALLKQVFVDRHP